MHVEGEWVRAGGVESGQLSWLVSVGVRLRHNCAAVGIYWAGTRKFCHTLYIVPRGKSFMGPTSLPTSPAYPLTWTAGCQPPETDPLGRRQCPPPSSLQSNLNPHRTVHRLERKEERTGQTGW